MSTNPIWIAGYGGPVTGAAPVWIAGYGAAVAGASEAWIAGYGGTPTGGASPVWIAGYGGAPAAAGASPIWIGGYITGSGGGGGTAVTTTWDPANKDALITLSGSNFIATSNAGAGSVNSSVRATTAITGKKYFEVKATGGVGQYFAFGIMGGTAPLNNNIGATNGIGVLNGYAFYMNGASLGGGLPNLSSGDIVSIAVDRTNNFIWWALDGGSWASSHGPGGDPTAGTGGDVITAVTGTIYPAISSAYTGDIATINGGAAGFAYTPPTGFTALDSP